MVKLMSSIRKFAHVCLLAIAIFGGSEAAEHLLANGFRPNPIDERLDDPKIDVGLEGYGLSVVESVPLEITPATEFNRRYLKTKKDKLGHKLSGV